MVKRKRQVRRIAGTMRRGRHDVMIYHLVKVFMAVGAGLPRPYCCCL
jgi:hypothetical protein